MPEPMFSAVSPAGSAASGRRHDGGGDVVDVHEVAALPPVLEDLGRPPSSSWETKSAATPAYGVFLGSPVPYTLWNRSAATARRSPGTTPSQVLAVELRRRVGVPGSGAASSVDRHRLQAAAHRGHGGSKRPARGRFAPGTRPDPPCAGHR